MESVALAIGGLVLLAIAYFIMRHFDKRKIKRLIEAERLASWPARGLCARVQKIKDGQPVNDWLLATVAYSDDEFVTVKYDDGETERIRRSSGRVIAA